MTLQQAKDQVAKKHGFTDWTDLQKTWRERSGLTLVVHEDYVSQVAELYARSKQDEGAQYLTNLQLELGALRVEVEEKNDTIKELTKERDELHALVLQLTGEEEIGDALKFKFDRKQI